MDYCICYINSQGGAPAYPANMTVTACLSKSVVAFAVIILITNPSYHW